MSALEDKYPAVEAPAHGAVSDEIYSYYAQIFNAITASPNAPLFSARQDMARRVWGAIEPLLTRVLAPDEATIERLARHIHDADCECQGELHSRRGYARMHLDIAHATLAALAGTAAQDAEVS